MAENRKTRIKRLIAEAHEKFITATPPGARLFWDLALNGVDPKLLYEEFKYIELGQIIDQHTGEKK